MSSKKSHTVKYPKTVIVVIAVHGFIATDSIYDIPMFKINDRIKTLIKLNVAPPGSAAAISGTDMDGKLQLLEAEKEVNDVNVFEEIINRHTDKYTADISKKTSEELLILMNGIKKELKSSYKLPIRPKFKNEYQTLNKGFNIFKYDKPKGKGKITDGDIMVNKSYGIEDNEQENESGINWKIQCLNTEPPTDLLKEIKIYNKEPVLHHEPREDDFVDKYYVTTEKIIDFLSMKGVKNILIVDLACSGFGPMSDIEIRRTRQFILKNYGYGGNKITNKCKKRRIKRTKKYSKNRNSISYNK